MRREHQVTYSHGVPTVVTMLLDAADQTEPDLAGWKMTVGGSALTTALYLRARERGMLLGTAYGMSETCPIVIKAASRPSSAAESDDALFEAFTSGLTVPLVDAQVVDEAMVPVPHDGETRGELAIRGPWLTPCYIKDVDGSNELWRGGWMHTQSVATIDAVGHVRIRDRLKDVVKTGGEWVDSIQLEELVATAAGVIEAAVVAVPDPQWGERPLAVIVIASNAAPTLATINAPVVRAIADGLMTRYAKLATFEILDQLPRTSVGKIDKKQLRARFG